MTDGANNLPESMRAEREAAEKDIARARALISQLAISGNGTVVPLAEAHNLPPYDNNQR